MSLDATSVKKMRVAELKAALAEKGLPVDGLRPALIERLLGAIGSDETTDGASQEPSQEVDASETSAEAPTNGVAEDGKTEEDAEPTAEVAAEPAAEEAAAEPTPAPMAVETPAAAVEEVAAPAAEAATELVAESTGDGEPEAKRVKVSAAPEIAAAPAAAAAPAPAAATNGSVAAAPAAAAAAAAAPAAATPASAAPVVASPAQPRPLFRMGADPRGREVFIDNLKPETTEAEIMELCKDVGVVTHVHMARDPSGVFRGLVLATFAERMAARTAKTKLTGKELHGQTIGVRESGTDNTVFLARVRRDWTEEQMQNLLTPVAEGLLRVDMTAEPSDPMRRTNRGFGFAVFETAETAKAFLEAYGGEGKLILEGVQLGVRPSTQPQNHQTAPGQASTAPAEEERTGVYVANVGLDLTEEELRTAFGAFGTITKAVLGSTMSHATRPDFAIVNFSTGKEAAAAVAGMAGKTLKGKVVEVTIARTTEKAKRRREMAQIGGGGMMGGGGYGGYGGGGYGGGGGGYAPRGFPPRGGGFPGGRGGGFGGRGGFQQQQQQFPQVPAAGGYAPRGPPQAGGFPRPYGGPMGGPPQGYPGPSGGYNAYQAPQAPYQAGGGYPQQQVGYGQQATPPAAGYGQQPAASQAGYGQPAAQQVPAAAAAPGGQQYPGYYDANGQYHWN